MGIAASSAQRGHSSPSGSGSDDGPAAASISLRIPTEVPSPHDSLAGQPTVVVTASVTGAGGGGGPHASVGSSGGRSGWSVRYEEPPLRDSADHRRRSSGGSHAGGRPASDDGGATSVQVKVMPLVQGKGVVKSFKITSAGGVLQGGMAPEVRDIAREFEKITGQALPRLPIDDRRAQQLLVAHVGEDYFVVPSPELFSRHTGTCRVLGDKHQRAADHPLQVGDYLRIGSVGLVVSEMHVGEEGEGPVAISERDLYYLREDAEELKEDLFALEEAATAAAERGQGQLASPGKSPRVAQCYMCFDDEDSTSNPLVAPCLCKGGTRYVHLTCLQRWQASAADDKDCVATSAERKGACKVCKSRYKTHVRTSDGRLLPLAVHQLPPPFICFLVVTKHEAAEELFNTQFQLSFAESKQIVIGRSRNCNMVLDYRTVSTQHATVSFRKGQFLFRDLSSSNGSMLNLRHPLKLPCNQWVRLRYGRSIVALKAKRSWVRRKLSSMGTTLAGAAAAAAAAAGSGSGGGGSGNSIQRQSQRVGGGRDSWGGGGGGGGGGGPAMTARMSVSQHVDLDMLLLHQQQEQQQAAAAQQADSSSSAASDVVSDAAAGANNPTAAGLPLADGQQLELLDWLCRIDTTPRPRSGLGPGGLLTPGGGRFYQSVGGSLSPGTVSTALFQLHLQASGSRRVFEDAAAEGLVVGDESVYEDAAAEHQPLQGQEEEQQPQQRKPRPLSLAGTGTLEEHEEGQRRSVPAAAARQIFHGVHFIPSDSPGENSPLSELGR